MRFFALIILLQTLLSCRGDQKTPKKGTITDLPSNFEKVIVEDEIECDLLPNIFSKSEIKVYMSEISASDYTENKTDVKEQLEFFTNSDSIEEVLQKRYAKIFYKKNNTYSFKGLHNENILVYNNLTQEKTYSKYDFKARYKDYIVLFQEFFEGGRSIIIDVAKNEAYIAPDKPYFITDQLFYSIGRGYGDDAISIIDIKKKQEFSLSFSNIEIKEHHYFSNSIYLKVECIKSRKNRYLRISKD